MTPEKLLKPYDPKATEAEIYKKWEESGFFNPDNLPARHQKPFTIIMPPPNANGRLHAGHSLVFTLEDIITRYHRMKGEKVLWVPGADHAGFETQIVYEKQLEKEGRSRFKMDPQDLYKEIMAFTLENKKNMEDEVRSLGASCDWSREKFTLDDDVVKETQRTFKKMFDDGLVYRGKRSINWCTKHQTSLSDVETESVEKVDKLYYIKYGPFVVATVRPETIFGDVAVAVNPNDKRYKEFVGKDIEVQHPENKLTLKVVADDMVDIEFGTGALKITPAHDANDFAVSERHNLPVIEVIDHYGRLNEKTGKYSGLKILEAREQVVADLTALGLIEKIEDYTHNVPTCYKCATVIEPRIMNQWFVKMKPLADLALDAYNTGKIKFIPESSGKIFSYWMENSIDWNISRQIVWGIPIPAKICSCGHAVTDLDFSGSAKCEKCGGEMVQDPDTFDTWFSSGQWPLLSLGYPDDSSFKTYYPTDVMETGRDLVFKWVPRMVIFGLYLAKQVPFHTVYMHGLVNDKNGKKMSKSKGNVVSPMELTAKYGTDALRIGLVIGNTPGNDLSLSEDKIRAYQKFANKIWNIARFVLTSIDDLDLDEKIEIGLEDETQLNDVQKMVEDVTGDMDNYRFYLAGEKIYHYVWHEFADSFIEEAKDRINNPVSPEDKKKTKLGSNWGNNRERRNFYRNTETRDPRRI
ncbi:MAG: valine--tRNA ligase [Candidatus Vogelbacteria bacterium]|nr:valine--tRNA ligase [Candidatus Vogelbacteria bacterium]